MPLDKTTQFQTRRPTSKITMKLKKKLQNGHPQSGTWFKPRDTTGVNIAGTTDAQQMINPKVSYTTIDKNNTN